MERVAVVGTSCAGKTTFARSLAARRGCPHIELDALHWLPGWKERDRDDFRSRVTVATSEQRWVVDGNYQRARDIIWPRATTLIWLNYGFLCVATRGIQRTIQRVWTREELFSGNRESFRGSFMSRDSILWWLLTTYRHRRQEYRKIFDDNDYPDLVRLEMTRPSASQVFLDTLGDATVAEPTRRS